MFDLITPVLDKLIIGGLAIDHLSLQNVIDFRIVFVLVCYVASFKMYVSLGLCH